MPGIRVAIACFFAALFLYSPALCAGGEIDFHFKGTFHQGGLVTGKAPAGSTLHFEGRSLRISQTGAFVIAFGRNAKADADLAYHLADGSEGVRHLTIASRDFPTEKINGLAADKVTPDAARMARIRAEGALLAKARRGDHDEAFFVNGFSWPVLGRISGVYGSQRILNDVRRSPHSGTDIAAPRGTPVTAPADGIVALRHLDMFFTGQTLVLDHGHGLFTVYAHLDRIDVEEGDRVKKGDPIATIGATGRATAPHLHWGISWFGIALDPQSVAGVMPTATPPITKAR